MSVESFPTYDQVLRSKFGGLVFDVREYGADPTGTSDSAGPAIEAGNHISTKGGGIRFWPPGTYLMEETVPIQDGVYDVGAGRGVTVLQAGAPLATAMFQVVIPTGGSTNNWGLTDMSFVGIGIASTDPNGIIMDTSASSGITYDNIHLRRLEFSNFYTGLLLHNSNTFGGWIDNHIDARAIYTHDNAVGMEFEGTWGLSIDGFTGYRNTIVSLATSGLAGLPALTGTPAAIAHIRNCIVSGRASLGSATDWGIAVSATDLLIDNAFIGNIGYIALNAFAQEEYGMVCAHINIQGAQYGILIGAGAASDQFMLTDFNIDNVTAQAIQHLQGSGVIANGTINGFSSLPGQAIVLGAGQSDAYNDIVISNVVWPGAQSAFLTIDNTQTGTVRVSGCPGYNPVGPVTITVPSSGTAVAAAAYDRTFYITQATAASSVAVQGQSIAIPVGGPTAIRVPAGQTLTPTYTTAPTWVVMGE